MIFIKKGNLAILGFRQTVSSLGKKTDGLPFGKTAYYCTTVGLDTLSQKESIIYVRNVLFVSSFFPDMLFDSYYSLVFNRRHSVLV